MASPFKNKRQVHSESNLLLDILASSSSRRQQHNLEPADVASTAEVPVQVESLKRIDIGVFFGRQEFAQQQTSSQQKSSSINELRSILSAPQAEPFSTISGNVKDPQHRHNQPHSNVSTQSMIPKSTHPKKQPDSSSNILTTTETANASAALKSLLVKNCPQPNMDKSVDSTELLDSPGLPSSVVALKALLTQVKPVNAVPEPCEPPPTPSSSALVALKLLLEKEKQPMKSTNDALPRNGELTALKSLLSVSVPKQDSAVTTKPSTSEPPMTMSWAVVAKGNVPPQLTKGSTKGSTGVAVVTSGTDKTLPLKKKNAEEIKRNVRTQAQQYQEDQVVKARTSDEIVVQDPKLFAGSKFESSPDPNFIPLPDFEESFFQASPKAAKGKKPKAK